MKHFNIFIFLITLTAFLILSSTSYTLEQPPSIKVGYKWAYDVTFYNKTSGEQYQYTSIVTVESVSTGGAVIRGELIDENNQTVITIYTSIDTDWRITNITYIYPDIDYTIQDVYTSDDKPLFMIYPSNINEKHTINALSDTYINDVYYYSTKEIYYISVPRIDKIIYKNHVIPSYVVTIIQELRDPDTDYLYTRINTTYWINKDFIHPFLILQEDNETKITYILKYYKLDYEPLDNYPTVTQKVYVDIKAELTGNYTLSVPDAKITISRNGETIGEYSIAELPVSISLDTGDYMFTITPIQGSTIDQKGLFKFLKWSINGVEQQDNSITISITDNTSITISFYVYSPPIHVTTTTTTITTTTVPTTSTTTPIRTTTTPITTAQGQEQETTTTTNEITRTTTPPPISNGGTSDQTTHYIPTTNPYVPRREKEDNTLYIAIGAVGLAGAGVATYLFFRKRRTSTQPIITTPYQPPHHPPAQSVRSVQYQQQIIPSSIAASAISVEKTKPKLKKCPYCGALIPVKAKYCPKCGKKLPETEIEAANKYKICPVCGARIPVKAKYCPRCGAKLI